MAIRDLAQKVSAAPSVSPQVLTDGTVEGATVDMQNFESAVVVVVSGTITDGTHTPSMEDSPDDSTWTAVAAGDLIGSFTAIAAANDDEIQEVGYKGSERYIRAKVVTASATTGGLVAAAIVRGDPRTIPA